MYKKGYIILILILATGISACVDIKNKKTTLEIVDNNRHYYPILQGPELDIVFVIKNVGEVPFMLSDIFTSCGCLVPDKSAIEAIPPGKEGKLILKYNTTKNIGYVEHYVTLYGNLTTLDKAEIKFDVHVVPNSLNTRDYEELYLENKNREKDEDEDDVNNEGNKGYYIDSKTDQ